MKDRLDVASPVRRSVTTLSSTVPALIAATALERNLTVVTIDTDFQRVPNLRVILLSRATMQVLSRP